MTAGVVKIPWGAGWEAESSVLGRVVEPAKEGEGKGDPQLPASMVGWVVVAAAGDAEIRSTGEGSDCGLGGGEAGGSAP